MLSIQYYLKLHHCHLEFFVAIGPVKCGPLLTASIISFVLLGVILLLSCVCACFTCTRSEEEDRSGFAICSFCCACILGVVFIALVIALSGVVFGSSSAFDAITSSDECDDFAATPIGTLAVSYMLILLISCCWCCCCFCFMANSKT